MQQQIRYKSGYKYQLAERYSHQLKSIRPDKEIETPWILLSRSGLITIKLSYAWDGASGPTIDTKSSMRGALVHDALAQLLRLGLLDIKWYHAVNQEFHDICVEDGMFRWRAFLWMKAVDNLKFWTRPSSEPETLVAP